MVCRYEMVLKLLSADSKLSESFLVQIAVPKGFELRPLLFTIVMNVLAEEVKDGPLLELLHADDLILIGASVEEVMEKYGKWEATVEGKCLSVAVRKTKSMQFLEGLRCASKKIDPCGVFEERVRCNSVKDYQCLKWVHRYCSDFLHRLSLIAVRHTFVSRSCLGKATTDIEV